MVVNVATNRDDNRRIINNGLAVSHDKTKGLGIRGTEDTSLINSVDNKSMVRNLCSSQHWHKMDAFLTFTCNMRHFGTNIIKEWIDSEK